MTLDANKEQLGRTSCKVEIDVLFEVSAEYANAVEAATSDEDEALLEAGQLVMACNDVLYKKLISECGFTFDEGEAFVQMLNLEALTAAKNQTVRH